MLPVRPQRGARNGFTLVELAIAIVVMVFALGALSSTVVSTAALARANDERARAQAAARRMAAELSVTQFGSIFAEYNTDPGDDPGGPGAGAGPGFVVRGLTPQRDDPDGLVGRIVFPTLLVGADLQLREDVDMPPLGMPRDLNGDGLDVEDHSDDYLILPVTIFVEWLGVSGNGSVRLDVILTE